jgi:YggT family protein
MPIALQSATLFLVNALLTLYIFILLVRFLLASVRADWFNPASQFFIKLTQPLVKPLRRIIPNYKSIEFSTLVVAFLLEILKFTSTFLIKGMAFNLPLVLLLSFADMVTGIINILFYAIIIQAVMSWIQPYSPVRDFLAKLTAPIMRPLHRIIPPIGGIDVSPVAAMILLQFINILLIQSLMPNGMNLFSS